MPLRYPEYLDTQVFPGLSLLFVLLFFAPLALLVLLSFLFVTERLSKWAKILTILWLVACLPAALLIFMGYAFNPHGWNPLIQVALWVLAGIAIIQVPLLAKQWLVGFWRAK